MEFENFKIRLLQPNEGKAFFNLIENNRSRLEDFFAGTVSKTKTLADTLLYCEEIQEKIKNFNYLPYMITDTNTGEFIGLVDEFNFF